MKFSIIIPAHNAEKYLGKCLDSIIQQKFTDYELIVVCDACTDNTVEIARNYEQAKVFEVDFHKDGLARNKGLDESTGEWVLFLDSDDWWMHEYVLSIIDSVLKSNKDCELLAFGFIWMDRGYCGPTVDRYHLYSNVWSKCWNHEFLKKHDIKFRDIYPHSDMYFVSDTVKKDPKIYYLDQPLYYYNYLREGSITHALNTHKDVNEI